MTDIPPARAEADPAIPAIRASDADRDQTLAVLRRHFADGRLTLPELEERVDSTCAATTLEQLAALTADLPAQPHQPTPQANGPDPLILGLLIWLCPPAALIYWLRTRR
jgi:Domain of unknown function (DUF1707)